MKSFEELTLAWAAAGPQPRGQGTLHAICLRLGGGRHALAQTGQLTLEAGLVGDRWRSSRDPERLSQVTIMNAAVAAAIAHGQTPGHDAGDNLLVDLDLSERALPVGSRVRVGGAVLEVTPEPHLGCKKFNQRFGAGALRWVNLPQNRHQRLRGVNLRVVQSGELSVGDPVVVLARAAREEAGELASPAP